MVILAPFGDPLVLVILLVLFGTFGSISPFGSLWFFGFLGHFGSLGSIGSFGSVGSFGSFLRGSLMAHFGSFLASFWYPLSHRNL